MQEMLYNTYKFFSEIRVMNIMGMHYIREIQCHVHKIKQSMKMHHFTELLSHIHYINVLTCKC
jgi:hypothetical protein